MAKLKVLMLNKWWAFTLGHLFLKALQRRDDIDLKTTGQFSGAYIPWCGGLRLPEKYVHTPDIPLSLRMEEQEIDYNMVKVHLGDWKPDLIINTSSTCYWKNKTSDGYSVAIAIDPHALNYDHARSVSDKFFNMQKVYSQEGDVYLPYAFDPTIHYEDTNEEKILDVCMVGLEYPWRIQLMDELRKRGLKCHSSTGLVYDEYRKIYSQSHIGLNWSSLNDLNARAFETPMMNIPVMNHVTDMEYFPAFQKSCQFHAANTGDESNIKSVPQAVEIVINIMNNLEGFKSRTLEMRKELANETYDARIQQILDTCGFGG